MILTVNSMHISRLFLLLVIFAPPAFPETLQDCQNSLYQHNCIGRVVSEDGEFYGSIKDNLPHGKGVKTYKDGRSYEGDFENGVRSGYGVTTISSKNFRFKGNFKFDKPNGQGEEVRGDGISYVGEYKDGGWHGAGKYTAVNGDVYEGQFLNGFLNGLGVALYKQGNKYEGEFKDGKRNGAGKYTAINGDVYEGQHINDSGNGFGKYLWKNGERYEGEFKGGNLDGQGTRFRVDGSVLYKGAFENGQYIETFEVEMLTKIKDFSARGKPPAYEMSAEETELTEYIENAAPIKVIGRYISKLNLEFPQNFPLSDSEVGRRKESGVRFREEAVEIVKAVSEWREIESNKTYWSPTYHALVDIELAFLSKNFNAIFFFTENQILDTASLFTTSGELLTTRFTRGSYLYTVGAIALANKYIQYGPLNRFDTVSDVLMEDGSIKALARGAKKTECEAWSYLYDLYAIGSIGNGKSDDDRYEREKDINIYLNARNCMDKLSMKYLAEKIAFNSIRNANLKLAMHFHQLWKEMLDPGEDNIMEQIFIGQSLALSKAPESAIRHLEALLEKTKLGKNEQHVKLVVNVLSLYYKQTSKTQQNTQMYRDQIRKELDGLHGIDSDTLVAIASQYDHSSPDLSIAIRKISFELSELTRQLFLTLGRKTEIVDWEDRVNGIYGNSHRGLITLLFKQSRFLEGEELQGLLKANEYVEFTRGDDRALSPTNRRITYTKNENSAFGKLRKLLLLPRDGRSHTESNLNEYFHKNAKVIVDEFFHALESFSIVSLPPPAKKDLSPVAEIVQKKHITRSNSEKLLQKFKGNIGLITYIFSTDELSIKFNTRNSVTFKSMKMNSSGFIDKVFEFRRSLRDPQSNPIRQSQELYDLLIRPIEQEVKQSNITLILLELDGALHYVPFGALHDGKDYVIRGIEFVNFSPLFTDNFSKQALFRKNKVGYGVTKKISEFNALPGVRDEITGFLAPAIGVHSREYIDEQFTFDSFGKITKQKSSLIHVATHFKFNPGTEDKSFLLLGDGRRLSLGEIRKNNIRFDGVDLLTLSACETALREISPGGGREISGFGAIAQRQGARSVLATLWTIEDRGTSKFMNVFYSKLSSNKGTKSGALKAAQLEFLQTPEYSHPFYWAPFILMGDWR